MNIENKYRKGVKVIYYFNPETKLNVMINATDNTFISGWKLSEYQIQALKNVGDVGAVPMSNFEENDNVLLENFKFWENKKFYLKLMKRFLDGEIDGIEFETEFYEMWYRDRDKTYNSEELLHIAEHADLSKFKGFSGIMSKLFTDCDVFEPDKALRKYYGISEEELRNFVKEAYLKIKDNYP